jgi:hypothetical protein
MAKISVLNVSPENEALYFKALQPGDRFAYSRISIKRSILSRAKLKGLTQKTLLPQITDLWNGLNQQSQNVWNTAASYSNMTGFRLFMQDTCYRLAHGISGLAMPNINHQYKVGELLLFPPATAAKLIQIHPSNYYVYRKVYGTKSQYNPVMVAEVFSLPFTAAISYKSDLTPTGSGSYAKFYADVISSYQAVDQHNLVEINIVSDSAWHTQSAQLTTMLGHFVSYELYIEVYNMQGRFLFDNIYSAHDSHNFARDWKCNTIETEFTKQFYQIPAHWAPVNLPTGAEYKSVYPED